MNDVKQFFQDAVKMYLDALQNGTIESFLSQYKAVYTILLPAFLREDGDGCPELRAWHEPWSELCLQANATQTLDLTCTVVTDHFMLLKIYL